MYQGDSGDGEADHDDGLHAEGDCVAAAEDPRVDEELCWVGDQYSLVGGKEGGRRTDGCTYGVDEGAEIEYNGVEGYNAHGLFGVAVDHVAGDDGVAHLEADGDCGKERLACGLWESRSFCDSLQRKNAVWPTIQCQCWSMLRPQRAKPAVLGGQKGFLF